jgi:hypothetical protein
MAEFFGRNREQEVGNIFEEERINKMDSYKEFCPCLLATGDDAGETIPDSANTKVVNLKAWQYIRFGLAVIGAYAVIQFIKSKIQK